jgi:hypothetical protein
LTTVVVGGAGVVRCQPEISPVGKPLASKRFSLNRNREAAS